MREISTQQVLDRMRRENPWWSEPHQVPALYADWTPRPYLDLFFPLVESRRVRRAAVLMGPRRVGKTVLLHHAIQRLLRQGVAPRRIVYVSIDHPLYNGLALERFLDLFQEATGTDPRQEETFVVFDEIQYLRRWEVHLKTLVDGFPLAKLVASGSAAAALKLKSNESGAGRFTDFLLPPLTFHEYLVLLDESELISQLPLPGELGGDNLARLNRAFLHYLNFGGYPEVIFSEEIQADPGRFVKADIVDKVLLRDLPSLYGIQDIQELNSLFTTLAYNTAAEVSLEELSSGSGVVKNTIKRYVEYLEAAFLLRVVHRVDRNARRFKRASRFKVYLTNPSIRAALFAPLSENDPAQGNLVETGIFAQWFHAQNQRLHYARWKGGEIDIVNLDDMDARILWAVEAKWSDRMVDHPEELREVVSFCRHNGLAEVLVTTRTRREVQERQGVRVRFMPAAEYCYQVGRSLFETRQGGAPALPASWPPP
jgi:uncharacterized protein